MFHFSLFLYTTPQQNLAGNVYVLTIYEYNIHSRSRRHNTRAFYCDAMIIMMLHNIEIIFSHMMKMNEYDENDDDILKSFISSLLPFRYFYLFLYRRSSIAAAAAVCLLLFCSVLYIPPSFCFSFVVLLFVPSLFILFLLLSSGFMLLYLCDFSGSNPSFCYRGFFRHTVYSKIASF